MSHWDCASGAHHSRRGDWSVGLGASALTEAEAGTAAGTARQRRGNRRGPPSWVCEGKGNLSDGQAQEQTFQTREENDPKYEPAYSVCVGRG